MECKNGKPPLNTHDAHYRAEATPDAIKQLGVMLRQTFNPPGRDAFGSKGNECHFFGYHRSRAGILTSPDSSRKKRDHSVQQDLDKDGNDNHDSAFDFT